MECLSKCGGVGRCSGCLRISPPNEYKPLISRVTLGAYICLPFPVESQHDLPVIVIGPSASYTLTLSKQPMATCQARGLPQALRACAAPELRLAKKAWPSVERECLETEDFGYPLCVWITSFSCDGVDYKGNTERWRFRGAHLPQGHRQQGQADGLESERDRGKGGGCD